MDRLAANCGEFYFFKGVIRKETKIESTTTDEESNRQTRVCMTSQNDKLTHQKTGLSQPLVTAAAVLAIVTCRRCSSTLSTSRAASSASSIRLMAR